MMAYDDECIYGADMPIGYRNPDSCNDLPDYASDSNQARKCVKTFWLGHAARLAGRCSH